MTELKECFSYRVWPSEITGRCLEVRDEKQNCVMCDEVIAMGRCPRKLKTPFRNPK
jgi:hypothetical protein